MKIATKKEKHSEIFVSIVILTLIALAVPIAAGGWTSDAPITIDTVVKKEGTGSIKVTSNQSVGWVNDNSIESGLSPALWLIAPEVFEKDSVWYLITTDYVDFYGYNWTGSTWQSDSGIISGLYSFGDIFATAVFYKDSTWYLIANNWTGYCYGYNWTGSAWQNDSAIASGLGTISGNYPGIDVFQKDGTWYLIAGNNAGTFTAYNWSGLVWQSDSAIVSGLGDIGDYSIPSVFYKDSKWYLVSGKGDADFVGFNWSGSSWGSDSNIVDGLYDFGTSCSYPNAFMGGTDFGDATWYLLAVEEGDGYWGGFNWSGYIPTCYFQNDFSPPISVTNVSKNTGYLALWYFIYDSSKINSNVKISIYTDDSNYMYWEISKTYFENDWNEIYLPMSEGTEIGTLSLSSISKFKLEIPGTEDPDMVHRIDYMRFVEYPYTLHNIYMQLETDFGGGAGTYFPPTHLVEFRLQNIYGSPVSDVTVTAAGYETTMGALSWLYSVFGYRNETRIHNTTMEGTTDIMGHLSFMMVETIKYKMDFVKESEGINKTMYFYPKESQYLIILTPTIQPDMIDYVNWNLSVEEISGDSTNRSLNFTYSDSMDETTQICFFVKDENRTEIYSTCSFADDSSVDTGHKVSKSSGATYFWGFNATHNTFGEIKGTKAVTFKSRLIDLQLTNESYYSWISIALLVMITSLFSAVTVKFGYVVVPFMAGFFYYIGFLEIAPTLITVIIILGILLYIGKRERETGL